MTVPVGAMNVDGLKISVGAVTGEGVKIPDPPQHGAAVDHIVTPLPEEVTAAHRHLRGK